IREIDYYLEENETLTYNGLNRIPYLEMVVNETLRKWPPLLVVDRRSNEPYTIPPERNGEHPVHVEKNTLIWIPVWCIHNDPQYWSEPHLFDPQRFARENLPAINRNAFLPFGLGP
ncbi:cytochrome P450, partial [Halostella sp. PRR32]|uniref:cytochrome P450 n=1 Tax=Halostella sp. PRR32 TaxID=3098147 RepID=UPI002B1D13E2